MEYIRTMFKMTPYDNMMTEEEKVLYSKNKDDVDPCMTDINEFISNLSKYKTYDEMLNGLEEAWERCKSKFQTTVPNS